MNLTIKGWLDERNERRVASVMASSQYGDMVYEIKKHRRKLPDSGPNSYLLKVFVALEEEEILSDHLIRYREIIGQVRRYLTEDPLLLIRWYGMQGSMELTKVEITILHEMNVNLAMDYVFTEE